MALKHGTGRGQLATHMVIVSQVVLGTGLVLLVANGRWVQDGVGLASVVVGMAALALGMIIWRLTGRRLPLVLADGWFLFYAGILLDRAGRPAWFIGNYDPGPEEQNRVDAIHALGGPQDLVGLVWAVAVVVSLVALVRARR
jgi:hypothetical protein